MLSLSDRRCAKIFFKKKNKPILSLSNHDHNPAESPNANAWWLCRSMACSPVIAFQRTFLAKTVLYIAWSRILLLMEKIRLTSLRLGSLSHVLSHYLQGFMHPNGGCLGQQNPGISTDFADWPSPTCLESSKPPKRDMALAKRTTWWAWNLGTAYVVGYLQKKGIT